MRLAQWSQAAKWLKSLPVTYFNQQHSNEYRYYSLQRHYDVEPWITRQWLDINNAYEHTYRWQKNKQPPRPQSPGVMLLQVRIFETCSLNGIYLFNR